MTHRARIVVAAMLLVAFGIGLVVFLRGREAPTGFPTVLRYDSGLLRYTYHVPTGEEGLFDVAKDPRLLRNLRDERADELGRMREELRKKIGVKSMEELKAAQRETLERLRALGYF